MFVKKYNAKNKDNTINSYKGVSYCLEVKKNYNK